MYGPFQTQSATKAHMSAQKPSAESQPGDETIRDDFDETIRQEGPEEISSPSAPDPAPSAPRAGLPRSFGSLYLNPNLDQPHKSSNSTAGQSIAPIVLPRRRDLDRPPGTPRTPGGGRNATAPESLPRAGLNEELTATWSTQYPRRGSWHHMYNSPKSAMDEKERQLVEAAQRLGQSHVIHLQDIIQEARRKPLVPEPVAPSPQPQTPRRRSRYGCFFSELFQRGSTASETMRPSLHPEDPFTGLVRAQSSPPFQQQALSTMLTTRNPSPAQHEHQFVHEAPSADHTAAEGLNEEDMRQIDEFYITDDAPEDSQSSPQHSEVGLPDDLVPSETPQPHSNEGSSTDPTAPPPSPAQPTWRDIARSTVSASNQTIDVSQRVRPKTPPRTTQVQAQVPGWMEQGQTSSGTSQPSSGKKMFKKWKKNE